MKLKDVFAAHLGNLRTDEFMAYVLMFFGFAVLPIVGVICFSAYKTITLFVGCGVG